MAENTYEGMFILDSNRYAANPDGIAGEVQTILERAGGKLLASRPWQDSKLSYPIKKHRKGMYYLTYFTCNTQGITELERLAKLNESILRWMIIALDPALVEPMLAMASGKGEIPSTFRDTESDRGAPLGVGGGDHHR